MARPSSSVSAFFAAAQLLALQFSVSEATGESPLPDSARAKFTRRLLPPQHVWAYPRTSSSPLPQSASIHPPSTRPPLAAAPSPTSSAPPRTASKPPSPPGTTIRSPSPTSWTLPPARGTTTTSTATAPPASWQVSRIAQRSFCQYLKCVHRLSLAHASTDRRRRMARTCPSRHRSPPAHRQGHVPRPVTCHPLVPRHQVGIARAFWR